jgi:hypothetical protein
MLNLKPMLMKKTLTIVSLVLTVIAVLAFSSFDNQDNTAPTYAIVHGMMAGKSIFVYYGSQTRTEEIPIQKGEDASIKIVDVLNDLSKKGFELVSSSTHAYGQGQFTVYDYTLKKTR